ncbi:MAG: hypothetical protein ACLRZH_12665 [Ruthenibacterium lactatiformans]
MLFGQTKHNRPFPFFEEIDASLVEVEQSPAAAQTKAMRQRYMQQQNAYLQTEYGAASMRSTVQAGYSARYGGASHGSGAGGASRPARQRASVGGGFSTVQAGSSASVPRTEGSGAYRPGVLVEHKVFGRGEVLKVTRGGRYHRRNSFDTAGVKDDGELCAAETYLRNVFKTGGAGIFVFRPPAENRRLRPPVPQEETQRGPKPSLKGF